MKLEFDTNNVNEQEATIIVGVLGAMFPDVLRSTTALQTVITGAPTGPTLSPEALAAADNGYMTPDPATVFTALQPVAAPAAPVASSPAPPAAAPATPGAAGGPIQIDANGLPWDDRIHATSAGGGGTKNSDGTWRAKRGVAGDLVASVTAELRARGHAAPSATPQPAPTPAPAAEPVPVAPVAAGTAGVVPVAPTPPAAPVTPPSPAQALDEATAALAPPAAPAPVPPMAKFGALMRKITAGQAAGQITTAWCLDCAKTLGLESVADFAKHPDDLLPIFEGWVDDAIAAATAS